LANFARDDAVFREPSHVVRVLALSFWLGENAVVEPVEPPVEPKKVSSVEARQGSGPRDMLFVLVSSLLLAGIVGTVLLVYFLA
jgi:hypothetical protein